MKDRRNKERQTVGVLESDAEKQNEAGWNKERRTVGGLLMETEES